jgi:two-component system, NarL family, sensor kinase
VDVAEITHRLREGRTGHGSVAASVARFTVAGVVVTLALAAVIAGLARRAGVEEGIRSAEQVAQVVARGVVKPLLTEGLARGEDAARAELRAAVEAVVASGPVSRVVVWDADGKVVWSTEREIVGIVDPLDARERAALETESVDSAVSDLDQPENVNQPRDSELLEVYVGVRDAREEPLLIEVYQGYGVVETAARAAWMRFAPASLGALLLLQAVQIPFAWRMAQRLRRHQETETELLQSVVDASEAERRRIAGEVHDGVVQELTGLTYDLDAARLRSRNSASAPDQSALIARTADRVRHSVTDLRSLLVDLNPPRLPSSGLGPALAVLAQGLEREGVEVRLDAAAAEGLAEPAATHLYRAALEALRNVSTHSAATRVSVVVRRTPEDATLVVEDDGRGLDEVSVAAGDVHGHLGLRALEDRLLSAGGSLTVSSSPGRGTRVLARVPLGRPGTPVGAPSGVPATARTGRSGALQ